MYMYIRIYIYIYVRVYMHTSWSKYIYMCTSTFLCNATNYFYEMKCYCDTHSAFFCLARRHSCTLQHALQHIATKPKNIQSLWCTLHHFATLCSTFSRWDTLQYTLRHTLQHITTRNASCTATRTAIRTATHTVTNSNTCMMQVVAVYLACLHMHIAGCCSVCCMLQGISVTRCSTNMHMRVYIYIYIYILMHIYMCVCLNICMYACINIFTYRYIYILIHTFIYIYQYMNLHI